MFDPEIVHPKLWELSQNNVLVHHAMVHYQRGDFTGYLDMLEHLVIAQAAESAKLREELIRMHHLFTRPLVIVPASVTK